MKVYIRPLAIEDAKISFRWRNDPEVWQLTGSRPDREITWDIERAWLEQVLLRVTERRFAICVDGTDQYIGNVQLTNILNRTAEFHIFLGERDFWGKGIATLATRQLLDIAFNDLQLDTVYLKVRKDNIGAVKVYQRVGFSKKQADDEFDYYEISRKQLKTDS